MIIFSFKNLPCIGNGRTDRPWRSQIYGITIYQNAANIPEQRWKSISVPKSLRKAASVSSVLSWSRSIRICKKGLDKSRETVFFKYGQPNVAWERRSLSTGHSKWTFLWDISDVLRLTDLFRCPGPPINILKIP